MTVKFTNNASTTVATGINTTATSLVVASAAGFPALSGSGDYCYLTIQQAAGTNVEVVKATALSSNTFTIVRAQDGTSAGSWSVSDVVELRVTAALLTDIVDAATHDSSVLSVDSTNNRVGVNDTTPSVTLDISGTDAIALPVGTTAQRPAAGAGRFRYNSSLSQFEGYTDAWGAIGGGGTNTFTTDTFTANGSLVAFNLSQTVSSANNLLCFIDGVFQTQDAYSIATASGTTTLTFSAAPANGRKIVVYSVAAGISGANLNIDSMTGDGSDTTLTLTINTIKENTQVFIDGVYQAKANYSISGTTLTFSTAPPAGSAVECVTMTQTEINVPVDGTITSAKLSGALTTPAALTVTGALAGVNATFTTADNSDNLTLTSTDADASFGSNIRMYRNSGSPADNDLLGNIEFEGRNDNSQDVVYGRLFSRISDASDGSEDGIMRFDIMKAGSLSDVLTINSDEIIINDGSYDYDFRVESNNSTHALFVEGSSSYVGIGTSSPSRALATKSSSVTVANFESTGSTAGLVSFSDSNTTNDVTVRAGAVGNNLVLQAGGSERMRIDGATGNVGIGRVPRVALDVAGEVAIAHDANYGLRFYNQPQNNWSSIGNNLTSAAANLVFKDSTGEVMRIESGKVGVGTSNPLNKFVVAEGTNQHGIELAPGTTSYIQAYDRATSDYGDLRIDAQTIAFATDNGTERMRLTGGNLLVGRTSASFGSDTGIVFRPNNDSYIITNGSPGLTIRRNSSDGDMQQYYRDGTFVGSIGVSGGNNIYISGEASNHAGLTFATDAILPTRQGAIIDNVTDLGSSSERFDDIYATNGTIQTSDRNEKQDITQLTDAEQRVAVAAKGLLRKFRWKDSVAEKGDNARIHFGIIAQDLQAAFEAESLDAGRYAMFMSNTWWETQTEVAAVEAVEATEDTEAIEAVDAYTRTDTYDTAEEAPEGATERTRLGVRYSELLAFIISAI